MQGAAKRWTQMATQDKQVEISSFWMEKHLHGGFFQRFEDLHQEEKDRYVKELTTWAASKEQAAAAAAPKKRQTSSSVKVESVRIRLHSLHWSIFDLSVGGDAEESTGAINNEQEVSDKINQNCKEANGFGSEGQWG